MLAAPVSSSAAPSILAAGRPIYSSRELDSLAVHGKHSREARNFDEYADGARIVTRQAPTFVAGSSVCGVSEHALFSLEI